MNNVQRFREVLNLFDNGSIISFPTQDEHHRYGMDDTGRIGYCTYDTIKNEFADTILGTDFSYLNWLQFASHGFKELYDDIFQVIDNTFTIPPALVITTNGDIDKNNHAVMGKGVALEFKKFFPGIEIKLGAYLKRYGNRAFNMGTHTLQLGSLCIEVIILTCPTKHHWKDNADMTLIAQSCEQLVQICDKFSIETCFLPAPGCDLGGLNYENIVKPLLDITLDERFYVCFKS